MVEFVFSLHHLNLYKSGISWGLPVSHHIAKLEPVVSSNFWGAERLLEAWPLQPCWSPSLCMCPRPTPQRPRCDHSCFFSGQKVPFTPVEYVSWSGVLAGGGRHPSPSHCSKPLLTSLLSFLLSSPASLLPLPSLPPRVPPPQQSGPGSPSCAALVPMTFMPLKGSALNPSIPSYLSRQ